MVGRIGIVSSADCYPLPTMQLARSRAGRRAHDATVVFLTRSSERLRFGIDLGKRVSEHCVAGHHRASLAKKFSSSETACAKPANSPIPIRQAVDVCRTGKASVLVRMTPRASLLTCFRGASIADWFELVESLAGHADARTTRLWETLSGFRFEMACLICLSKRRDA